MLTRQLREEKKTLLIDEIFKWNIYPVLRPCIYSNPSHKCNSLHKADLLLPANVFSPTNMIYDRNTIVWNRINRYFQNT